MKIQDMTFMQKWYAARDMGVLGGFAKRIGDAWYEADNYNRRRIEDTFPDLFEDVWRKHPPVMEA